MFRCSLSTECREMAYGIHFFTTSKGYNIFSHRGCEISNKEGTNTELGANNRRKSGKRY